MKILITGASGFIGKNLSTQLQLEDGVGEIIQYTTQSKESIEELLDSADFIYHLAGVNRPKTENEFETGNIDFTRKIVDHLRSTGKKTPIVFTSSIHAELDTAYGKSKLSAEGLVSAYSQDTGSESYILRLPNVFGKWSRPNYNSAIATFCHNLTHSLPININDPSAQLTLLYIDDLVGLLIDCLKNKVETGDVGERINKLTLKTTVGEVVSILENLIEMRQTLVIPDLSNRLTKYLHSTLTSFYDKQDLTSDLTVNRDERGWLFELTKSEQFGQIFISETKPGYSRGEHWHNTKVERFCVIQGSGEVFFRKVGSDEVFSHKLTGDCPQIIDIPVGYVHAIQNTGTGSLLLVIWANEILNKDSPDTYWERVRR